MHILKYLHKQPNKNEIKINEGAKNSKYLPISFLEMTLDELFFGAWETNNFNYQVYNFLGVCVRHSSMNFINSFADIVFIHGFLLLPFGILGLRVRCRILTGAAKKPNCSRS